MDKLSNEDKEKILKMDAVIKISTVIQIIKCIDIAAQRGAFRGQELSFVGLIHDNLTMGINKAYENLTKNTPQGEK